MHSRNFIQLLPKKVRHPSILDELSSTSTIDDTDEDLYDLNQYANSYKPMLQHLLTIQKPISLSKSTVTNTNRLSLVNWTLHFTAKAMLAEATFFHAVRIFDSYLSSNPNLAFKNAFTLMVSCLILSCKYNETYIELAHLMFTLTIETSVQEKEIFAMEIRILKSLDYSISMPTCLEFLGLFSEILSVRSEVREKCIWEAKRCVHSSVLSEMEVGLFASAVFSMYCSVEDLMLITPYSRKQINEAVIIVRKEIDEMEA